MRRGPLRHPWFAAFTASVAMGSIADEVSRLALPLIVLDLTHSLGAAALLRVTQFIPYVFFGPLVGVMIDRVDKRRLLIAAGILGIAFTAAIPLAVIVGIFSLPLLFGLAFMLGIIEVIRGTTTDFSVVPALVDEVELTAANALYLGADRGARVVGPVLGGLAIQAVGNAEALWIAALAFIPTGAVLLRMPGHILAAEPGERDRLGPATVIREIREGFSFIWRSRILRAVVAVMFVGNLGGGGLQTVILYVLSVEQGLSPATIGLLFSGLGIMSIAGSIGAPTFTRGRPMGHTLIAVQVVSALAAFVMGGLREGAALLGAYAVRQVASSAWVVYVFTPRQREVPRELRGRANGAIRSVVLLSNAASPALLSAIQAGFGTAGAFIAAGIFTAVSGLVVSRTALRDYDVREPRELTLAEVDVKMDPTAVD